jgi:hypothetical protein
MRTRIVTILVIAFGLVTLFAFSPVHHAQDLKSISMAVAYVQDAAPVQINSATHGTDFLFSKAEVKNVSEHAVRSITFGVFFHGATPNSETPLLVSGREIPTHLKPGESRVVDVLAAPSVKPGAAVFASKVAGGVSHRWHLVFKGAVLDAT